jgi:hypothetical protein
MYGLFLQSLGYAKDLDLSELEIALEGEGRLAEFEATYARLQEGMGQEQGLLAFSLSEASRVMNALEPDTYPFADSWVKAVKDKSDITPGKLAERATELMKRRKPGHSLMFVVDEVGQFVARDVQKMLDLQAVVQQLGVKGRGKHWVVVTSQEKLGELVSGLDDKKIELARLMERFPLQVHLEPSDISEVTSRACSKNAGAQAELGKLYDEHRGRLTEHTKLSADIQLPELTRETFIDLYPLLPYQIDLIIQVVSGLRTQGGASKHVGGANRTIIKLAQQLLINPGVRLADAAVGALARLDQVYDLVEGNIGSRPARQDHRDPQDGEPSARAGGGQGRLPAPVREERSTARPRTSRRRCTRRSAPTRGWPTSRTRWPSSSARTSSAAATTATASRPRPRTTGSGPATHRSQARRRAPAHRRGHHVVLAAAAELHAGRDQGLQGRPGHPQPRGPPGDLVFYVQLADDGPAFTRWPPSCGTAARPSASTSSGRCRWPRDRPRAGRAVPVQGDHRQASARPRATTCRRCSTRSASACAATPKSCAASSRRRAWPGRCSSRATTAARGDRAGRRGQGRDRDPRAVLPRVFERYGEAAAKAADLKKGTDALFTADNLNGLPRCSRSSACSATRRASRSSAPRAAPCGGDGPYRGARQLRRHRERPLPRRRVRQGALRLGLRGGAPVRRWRWCAPARSRSTSKGQTYDVLTGVEARNARTTTRSARARSGPRRASSSKSW